MAAVSLEQVRELLVVNCMLKVLPETIQDETPLFGPDGLGLDSLDALQLTMAIELAFQTPIKDPILARQILQTPGTIRQWVERQEGGATE
jgi:acyl carrier protein